MFFNEISRFDPFWINRWSLWIKTGIFVIKLPKRLQRPIPFEYRIKLLKSSKIIEICSFDDFLTISWHFL